MGLSSTMRVRMPPDRPDEDDVKDARDRGRSTFAGGTIKVGPGMFRDITDAGRGGYSDPGLHGGVIGKACEGMTSWALASNTEVSSPVSRVQAKEAVVFIERVH